MNDKQDLLSLLPHEVEQMSVRAAGCGSAQAVHDRPSEPLFRDGLDHQPVKTKPVKAVEGGKQIGRRFEHIALGR